MLNVGGQGKLPFDDDNIRRLLDKVKSGQFSMPQYLHKDVRDLITRMLTVDPAKRITLPEIKAHPWFNFRPPPPSPPVCPLESYVRSGFAHSKLNHCCTHSIFTLFTLTTLHSLGN
jgi:serine/threonine protein kinase